MKPHLTFEESLAAHAEYERTKLNKNTRPCMWIRGDDFDIKALPPSYRFLSEEEKTGEWVQNGLVWYSTTEDQRGIWTLWEENVDEKGRGIYTQPGHLYAVPV